MQRLIEAFQAEQNLEQAVGMAAYMKNQFSFLGIPKPRRVQLQKEYIKQAQKKGEVDWEDLFSLWERPEREYQYTAVDYLRSLQDLLRSADIDNIKRLIVTKSWWDTVDLLASGPTGYLCLKHPDLVDSRIIPWSHSENMWLVRTALLYQLKYKANTDTGVLEQVILTNRSSQQFFINKAIGWILREYSKTDNEWVARFLADYTLSPLSVREASKYLTK